MKSFALHEYRSYLRCASIHLFLFAVILPSMRPAKKIQLKEFVSCMCRISVIGSFKTLGEIKKKPIKAL
jgi:hypothetical protein